MLGNDEKNIFFVKLYGTYIIMKVIDKGKAVSIEYKSKWAISVVWVQRKKHIKKSNVEALFFCFLFSTFILPINHKNRGN